jgi:hypothetical protein
VKEQIFYLLHDGEIRRHFLIEDDNDNFIASGDVGIAEEELLELYSVDAKLALQDYRMKGILNPPEPEPQPLTEAEQMQIETYLNTAFIADMMALSM